jgi:hypothetical protein
MAAIIRRLTAYGIKIPAHYEKDTTNWTFARNLCQENIDFRPLVKNHPVIVLEYSVHCTKLARNLLTQDASMLREQFEAALMMAELLECIYCHYLIVPREVAALVAEQNVYRAWLSIPLRDVESGSSFTKQIRDKTASSNWSRLFLVRLRRLLIVITPFTQDFDRFREFVAKMEPLTAPVVVYLSWMFFVPRLLTNILLTLKHLVPGYWMSKKENDLGWESRCRAQSERRWMELANDSVWFSSGLVNCFVLTGALAPISFYTGLVLQTYDLLLASIRAYLELSRMTLLEEQYQSMLLRTDLMLNEINEIKQQLSVLKERRGFESMRLYLSITNNAVLVIAVALALPVFAFNPIFPALGAALAVLDTVACYTGMKWLETQKPVDKVKLLSKAAAVQCLSVVPYGFFNQNALKAGNLAGDKLFHTRTCSLIN